MKSKDKAKQTLHAKFYASRVKKNRRIRRGVKYAPPPPHQVQSVFKSPGKIRLNYHFPKICKNPADKVRPERNHSLKNYLTDAINESLFLRPTDNNEVLKEINQLKNKATIDIRVSLLKHIKQEIIKGLVINFQQVV